MVDKISHNQTRHLTRLGQCRARCCKQWCVARPTCGQAYAVFRPSERSKNSKTLGKTADYTPPSVISVTHGEIVGSKIESAINGKKVISTTFTFSEAVSSWPFCDPCSKSVIGSIKIDGNEGALPNTFAASSKELFTTFGATLYYEAGATYEVSINKDWFRDSAGNFMEEDANTSITFTTE